MIVVEVVGGLGNQMFQYAAAKSLADRLGVEFCIDGSAFEDYDRHAFGLDSLSLTFNMFERKKYKISEKPKNASIKKLLSSIRKSAVPELELYIEKGMKYDTSFESLPDNTYLRGYFQSEKYFGRIGARLLDEFKPMNIGSYAKETASIVRSHGTTVSLHIRRGDYVSNKSANKYHGVMGLEYYVSAIAQISKSIPDHTVVVFSDDIPWCKENIPLTGKHIWIDGNHSPIEGIYLMSQCSHNIIANSSYSWWGAWLNTNQQKIVVAPKRWFNDSAIDTSDLVPESWLRI